MPYYIENDERHEFDVNININDIKDYFRQSRGNTGVFFSMFETGLDGNRFDMIRINPYSQYIRIFEFKSSRRDFLSDKKWQNYLPYCHTFTFVCPREVINKDDLPKGIGLLWIFKWRWKNSLYNHDWKIEREWIKRPRKYEVGQDIINRLAFMLIYRTIWRKDDVF